jgi:hypothetical protein
MLKVAKGGRRKSPGVVGLLKIHYYSLLDILFFMIWTYLIFDF